RPGSAHAHNNVANAFRLTGRPREAVAHYEISLKVDPSNANTWNNLALLLATCWDATVRDGSRAVNSALRALQLTAHNPVPLATLAAAYAEAGRFNEAVATIQRALELAAKSPNSSLLQALQSQLELYRIGVPFHEPVQPNMPLSPAP